ncbi:hypothetical protein [Cupriavidus sp. BIC8F]|uniref:hypothetical protein n=1 Tax=Cupriavidus sp. BIC8F TaxID=3079014 RepID=UPI0029161E1B|nr:hypothetical protein [Cupriavidus sp. BIC8F]
MTKETSKNVASKASEALKASTSPDVKKVAASVLTQSKAPAEGTSAKVATTAAKILKDGRFGADAKSIAGSALSQKTKK